jgi:thiol:disulfide interchange protein DsbD
MSQTAMPPHQEELESHASDTAKSGAPGQEPVQWTAMVSPTRVAAKGRFQVRVQAEIASGYHLYAVSQAPGGPSPTSITLPAGSAFTLRWPHISSWPAPVKVSAPEFGMEIEYHVRKVIFDFTALAAADAAPGTHEVVVEIHYQLCDEHTCLVPETKQLRVPIEVIAGEAEAEKPSTGEDADKKAAAEPASQEALFERLRAIMENSDAKKRETELWRLAEDSPKFDFVYQVLATPFVARADFRGAAAIYRKGLAANPDSDNLHAAQLNCSAKPAVKRRGMEGFIRRFPRSQYSLWFLQQLADEASSPAARLKLLRRAVAVDKSGPSSFYPLSALCWQIALVNPGSAAKLAVAWRKAAERRSAKGKEMPLDVRDLVVARTAFFVALANCDRLLKRGKVKAAMAAVKQISAPEVPHYGVDDNDRVLLALIQAKVQAAAGEPQRAYDGLISHTRLLMSDEMLAAAVRLGGKLGKSRQQVEADAWKHRLDADNPVAEFEVPGPRGRTIKASEYRGHPLLVNVWNPG